MITTSAIKTESVSFSGVPTEKFTWFKGYAWQIFNCKRCGLHLGWRYTSRDDELDSGPLFFYGIRRLAIRTGFDQGHLQDEEGEGDGSDDHEESWVSASSGDEEEESEGEIVRVEGQTV